MLRSYYKNFKVINYLLLVGFSIVFSFIVWQAAYETLISKILAVIAGIIIAITVTVLLDYWLRKVVKITDPELFTSLQAKTDEAMVKEAKPFFDKMFTKNGYYYKSYPVDEKPMRNSEGTSPRIGSYFIIRDNNITFSHNQKVCPLSEIKNVRLIRERGKRMHEFNVSWVDAEFDFGNKKEIYYVGNSQDTQSHYFEALLLRLGFKRVGENSFIQN